MHKLKQAEQDQLTDDMVLKPLINESNLATAFNHYSDDELINLIISGKKFIRLDDGDGAHRLVEIDQIHTDIASDSKFSKRTTALLAAKEFEHAFDLVDCRIRAIIKCEIAQIKLDWFDLLTGA